MLEVDPNGDVDLKVGGGSSARDTSIPMLEFKVSSTVLSATSPVFKALLEPKFREGKALERDGKVSVSLPEDDPLAMGQILCILHSKTNKVSLELTTEHVNDVAVLCDKYACQEAVKLAAHLWVRNCRPNGLGSRFVLLEATWMFNDDKLVDEVGRDVVLNAIEAVNKREFVLKFARIPEGIFDKLELTRLHMHGEVSRFLQSNVEQMAKTHRISCPPGCPQAGNGCASLLSQFESNGLADDKSELSLDSLLDKLSKIRLSVPAPVESKLGAYCFVNSYATAFKEQPYRALAVRLRSDIQALRLQSARCTNR